MSSSRPLLVLLAVLATSLTVAVDEDFAFDVSDDLEIELPQDPHKNQGDPNDLLATVGHVFHFTVPERAFGKSVTKYDAKTLDGLLPNWLMFDKATGMFWGVPLPDDVQTTYISVRGVQPSDTKPLLFKLVVEERNQYPSSLRSCPNNQDITVLTLLLGRDTNSIKPKQRVMAINNIAKFFGLPHSAFSLNEDKSSEGNTDSPVLLSGSGDLVNRKSKLTTSIQVPVGCDGRLWLNTVTLVHQLKKQAKDGTISGVLRLPLVSWRIQTKPAPALRKKRYIDENGGPVGSGDYDYDYDYEEGEDYDDSEGPEEEEGREETETEKPPAIIRPPQVEISTVSVETETHPHRHHHGEIRPIIDIEPSIQVVKEPTLAELPSTSPASEEETETTSVEHTTWKHSTEFVTPKLTSQSRQTQGTSTPSTTTTSAVYTSEELATENEDPVTRKTNLYRPIDVPDEEEEDYGEEYDDSENGDDDDDDDEEGITEIPIRVTDEEVTMRVTTKAETTSTTKATTKIETTATEMVTTTEGSNSNQQTETAEYEPETTPIFTTIQEAMIPKQEIPVMEALPSPATTSTEATTSFRTTITFSDTTTMEENNHDDDSDLDDHGEDNAATTVTSKHTSQRHTTMTQESSIPTVAMTSSSTFTPSVTESVVYEYEVKNFAPTIQKRLNSIAVTAGKIFEYYIPENTFSDMEDGNNLSLQLLDHEGNPLDKDSWCQFNPRERKIYGLPVEEDVSGWEYILKATDSEGASVADHLKIRVQHHKSRRVVNHEFSLFLTVEKKYEFPHSIDWALRTLRGLGSLYSPSNMSEITVRKIEHEKEPMVFTWTNDSLPKKYCPRAEILKLFSVLTANDRGDPSKVLSLSLAPEIRVKRVSYQGIGICESQPPPPPLPPTNYSPILRNPVDHINATIGELLVYTVPDDTFYDPEDVEGRNLKMTLLTSDQKPLPSDNWLQFDSKNREFFGIPLPSNVGRTEYVLVCEDAGGLTATDSLIVEVHAGPRINYNVEFSMTVETGYETFATSPSMQRKFIEKLTDLFEDRDTSYIHLSSITKGSTIVSWYNKSLPTNHCPRDEIKRLEAILVNNKTINSRVQDVMNPEFPVSTIKLQPLGICKSRPPTVQTPHVVAPSDESAAQESHEEYLITFIVPAVIIAVMLLLAGIAACVLYRRRRSGKMNVEEDGRQSYGNKGIPVIFQEELEEKPDPGTKAPVILKDEKPPLAPPEYSKSGSLKLSDDSQPYHPPPPFTRTQDNGKQSRPKPTPTYRKPPPYVPP